MATWTGGCLCGAVRYRIDADPISGVACHCRDCRYVTGGAEADFVIVTKAAFSKLSGEETVHRTVADSGVGVWRAFCPTCGTPLFCGSDRHADHLFVYAGTFDDAAAFTRESHIWMRSAPSWHAVSPDEPAFPGEHDSV